MKTFTQYLNAAKRYATFEKSLNENEQMAHLAIKIRMVRDDLGLYQADVAKLAGVTQQQVSKIEMGLNSDTTTLMKICLALGIDLQPVVNNKMRRNK